LKFPFAMAVVDERTKLPVYYVTLEEGFTGSTFLCVFDRNGKHGNLGTAEELRNEARFTEKALTVIRDEFRVQGPIRELRSATGMSSSGRLAVLCRFREN
jgi:hypothetical protein